jgi:hypothetical protein
VSNTGTVISIPGGVVYQNTSPKYHPSIAWGGAHDCYLVISDSPEDLTDSNMTGNVATLYEDLSGSSQTSSHHISGEVRVFLFHANKMSATNLDIGFTIKNASTTTSGTLSWYSKSGQGKSTNAVQLGQQLAYDWFSDLDQWTVEKSESLGAGATASFWVSDVPYPPSSSEFYTAIMWYDLTLTDSSGNPLPMDVQVWARVNGSTDQTWGAPPLAPTGKIRATIPHSEGTITFPYDYSANGNIIIDAGAQDASQGPSTNNSSPYQWPTNQPQYTGTVEPPPYLEQTSTSVGSLASGACTVTINGVAQWCYDSDPLGFSQSGTAGEYVAGWDWLDQNLDSASDPTTPGMLYSSTYWGISNLKQFNYGDYGVELHFNFSDPTSGHAFQLGFAPPYSPHSAPIAWYDKTNNVASEVPWSVISGGQLGYTQEYIAADNATAFDFITTMTAGGTAPIRIVLQNQS